MWTVEVHDDYVIVYVYISVCRCVSLVGQLLHCKSDLSLLFLGVQPYPTALLPHVPLPLPSPQTFTNISFCTINIFTIFTTSTFTSHSTASSSCASNHSSSIYFKFPNPFSSSTSSITSYNFCSNSPSFTFLSSDHKPGPLITEAGLEEPNKGIYRKKECLK